MLYGHPLAVKLSDPVAPPEPVKTQHEEARNRNDHLDCVLQNPHAHSLVPCPSNPADWPDGPRARVLDLMLQDKNRRREAKERAPLTERKESRFYVALQKKRVRGFNDMAGEVGCDAQTLMWEREQGGKAHLTCKHYDKVLSSVRPDAPENGDPRQSLTDDALSAADLRKYASSGGIHVVW
jgi:hypothetical protein